MAHGHFIWTDLSTYDAAVARSDYARLFDWRFQGDPAYDFATAHDAEVAAIFPMPTALAQINMPSFWMSYLHVHDLDAAVAKARRHSGVIVEVEPEPFGAQARISLVRDPSGAGFTMYEGPEIAAPPPKHGTVTDRYHHLPDINLIQDFYSDIFDWRFVKTPHTPWPVFQILSTSRDHVAYVEEVPESVRGKYRYWMPCFRVRSAPQTLADIEARGGALGSELTLGRYVLSDRQGAHFMVQTDRRL